MSFMFVSTEITFVDGSKATVWYLGEEGKKRFEQLLQNVGRTDKFIDTVFERLNKMQDELVRAFFVPRMQALIVEELRTKDKTQQEIAKKLPDFTKNPMLHHGFYEAWEGFEKAGVIVPISHGRGYPRTWQLSLKKEE